MYCFACRKRFQPVVIARMSSEQEQSWMHQEVEALLERFEQAWQPAFDSDAEPPLIDAYSVEALKLADERFQQEALGELVKIDLEYRWRLWRKRGGFGKETKLSISDPVPGQLPATPHIEDYLRRIPELVNSVALATEEFRVRHKYGDKPAKDEFLSRFTPIAEELSEQLHNVLCESDSAGDIAGNTPGPNEQTVKSISDPVSQAKSAQADDARNADGPAKQKDSADSKQASAPPQDDLDIPTKIGRYNIEDILGEGAFGSVYLAYDPDLDRRVAIKAPHLDRFTSEEAVEIFMREAKMAAQLQHSSTVRVFDIDREGQQCYIVMEYIEGPTLRALSRKKALTLTEIARIMSAVGDALHEAHKLGLVHRDLKPGNVLIDKQGAPRVADFGLAVLESDQRSRAGEVSGTPAYMSPEQVRGETHRLDGRCDIWAMGVMLYELLTGRKPFDGPSVYDVFDEIKHREPKPPRQIDDSIPVSLERIVQGCLTKNIAERYSTARDVADDLRRSMETSLARMEVSHGPSAARSGSQIPIGPANWRGESTSQSSGARTFPRASGRMVGRDAEQAAIAGWLTDDQISLVTVTGTAGIGKSRLAQELGSSLMPRFPGGCWWCDLSNATSSAAIAHAVLTAFEIPPRDEGDPIEIVGSILELRRPLMLIFDQSDHAISQLLDCMEIWRRVAPRLTCLITARLPLGGEGEQQYELEALECPQLDECDQLDQEQIEQYASVQLFVDRAQHAHRHFSLDTNTVREVGLICSHLEGIPLALELAAARVKVLKPAQMLKKIDRKFQLLSSTRKDLPPRQRTLAGAIDLSYEQLADWERAAFQQACVFSGGFFLDAAEAVIDLEDFPDAPLAMDAIQSLREKSLLRVRDEHHELRFDMYRSIREYGEERRRAESAADESSLRQRFAEYLADYAEEWAERIPGVDGPEALDRLLLERENLLAAETWAVEAGENDLAARAILAVHRAVEIRGGLANRVQWLSKPLNGASEESRVALLTAISEAEKASGEWDAAMENAKRAAELANDMEACRESADALRQMAEMYRVRGDISSALQNFELAEQVARTANAEAILARTIAMRGFAIWQQGKFDEAMAAYDEAVQIANSIGNEALLAAISRQRGHVFMRRGNLAVAEKCFMETESIARRRNDKKTLHLTTSSRGMALAEQGKFDDAIRCYNEAERTTRQLGEKRGIATNQGNRGLALADRGDYAEALECFARAETINRELENRHGIALNLGNRGAALAAMGKLDESQEAISAAIALHKHLGNRFQMAVCKGDLAGVQYKQGDLAVARESLQECLETLQELSAYRTPDGFLYLSSLALVLRDLGETTSVAECAAATRSLASELGIDEHHPRVRVREAFESLRNI